MRDPLEGRRGKTTRQKEEPKATRQGTPIRNGLLMVVLAVALVLLVLILPNDKAQQQATVLAPGGVQGDGTAAALPLRISEVMSSNKRAYPDDLGNYPDWVEIQNTSDAPVSLNGVGLSDRDDRVLFLFPDIQLEAGGHLVVFCDDQNRANKNEALHARFKVSALGDSIYLYNNDAVVIDSVEVPAMESDYSYALVNSGWTITEKYTPGYPNTDEGYEMMRVRTVASADGLILNEVLASNRTSLQDEDGEYADWIELYNGGNSTIDLSNYALSDDESNLVKWRFPKGAVIKPGEYYIVFASGKDRPGDGGSVRPHTNFKLAAEKETVLLSDVLSQIIDRTTYENLGKDISWGRVVGLENAWQEYNQPTPGLPNDRSGELEMDKHIRARNTSGVYISEVMTSNTGIDMPVYGNNSFDWVELVNLGSEPVDLTEWGLSDNVGRPRKWQFPYTVINPGEYVIVLTSGYTESPTGRKDVLHADFRLSALGEPIVLSDPKGNIVDKLVVPKLEQDNSYGRNFDQGGLFYYETATPGASNATVDGFAGYTEAPKVSMKGGIFLKPQTVTLSAPEGIRIRYTTDGSDPTETVGTDYTGPIVIDDVMPLRVRGFSSGYKPSEIVTETFLINIYPSLPIIALTTDPDNLYNPETGILAEDPEVKATLTKVAFKELAYWQKIPHEANFEFFLPDGQQMLNQGVEIQLNGQYSMDQAQKSFRVTAKARYGKSTLAYPFFDDRPFTEYQAVILRNGGQDGKYTRIIDALQSKIVDWTGADIMHMASTPVLCYLNGQYWGHYNLRERINKHSIAAYEGWSDPENIDFIKGNNNVLDGTYTNYKELLDFVKANDLNDPEALQTVLDWVDVDNYFDFMIFQIYFGNTDAGNIKFYRQRVDGAKWRWCLFDLDWGYFNSATNGCSVWLKPEGAGDKKMNNSLIRALLAVPEMQDKFLTRFGYLFQNYLSDTERISEEAARMLAVIEPELQMHFLRWAGLNHPLVSEEPTTPEGLQKYWNDRVTRMYNVLKKRPNICWGHIMDWFDLTEAEMEGYFGPQPVMPEDAY